MFTTMQKHIVDTQKIINKESKHITREKTAHQKRKQQERKVQRFYKINKYINKMMIVSSCLFIITLNRYALNFQIKRHSVDKGIFKSIIQQYVAIRDLLHS